MGPQEDVGLIGRCGIMERSGTRLWGRCELREHVGSWEDVGQHHGKVGDYGKMHDHGMVRERGS